MRLMGQRCLIWSALVTVSLCSGPLGPQHIPVLQGVTGAPDLKQIIVVVHLSVCSRHSMPSTIAELLTLVQNRCKDA